jgi:type VI protein secretion system component VasK
MSSLPRKTCPAAAAAASGASRDQPLRRRLGTVARALVVALLVAAAAAGATFANVSLLGSAERSGDPIGKLAPTSFRRRAAPPALRPHDDGSQRPAAGATTKGPVTSTPPATLHQAPAARSTPHAGGEPGRAGSHADD